MEGELDLTISIVSFNSKKITRQALQSIYKHTRGISFEVIVVDNGSTDGTAEMIKREFPGVRLIQSSRNLGFGAAHNIAIQHSLGRYILVLNSDVIFRDNAAKRMIETYRAWGEKAGALGPRIITPEGEYVPTASHKQFPPRLLLGISLVNYFFPFLHFIPLKTLRKYFGSKLKKMHGKFLEPNTVERVEWVDGVCVLFSRDVLEQVGLFDEQYFFDMEIGDLEYRIRKQGWEIIFDAKTTIVHLGGYSRRRNPAVLQHSVKSILVYYSKFRPEYVSFIKCLLFFLLSTKMLIAKLLRKSNDVIFYRRIRDNVTAFSVNDAQVDQLIPRLSHKLTTRQFSSEV